MSLFKVCWECVKSVLIEFCGGGVLDSTLSVCMCVKYANRIVWTRVLDRMLSVCMCVKYANSTGVVCEACVTTTFKV